MTWDVVLTDLPSLQAADLSKAVSASLLANLTHAARHDPNLEPLSALEDRLAVLPTPDAVALVVLASRQLHVLKPSVAAALAAVYPDEAAALQDDAIDSIGLTAMRTCLEGALEGGRADPIRLHELVWGVLLSVPQLAEKHNGSLLPAMLTFVAEEYNPIFDEDTTRQDVSKSNDALAGMLLEGKRFGLGFGLLLLSLLRAHEVLGVQVSCLLLRRLL